MTYQKYRRMVSALSRLGASPARSAERAVLEERISLYRSGGLRCINGTGKTRHPSRATA